MTIYQQCMSLPTLAPCTIGGVCTAIVQLCRSPARSRMYAECVLLFVPVGHQHLSANTANHAPLSGLASPAISVKLLRPPYFIALPRAQYSYAGCLLLFVRTINIYQRCLQTRDQNNPSPSCHQRKLHSIRQISSLSGAVQRCVSGMCCCLPAIQTIFCMIYTASHHRQPLVTLI